MAARQLGSATLLLVFVMPLEVHAQAQSEFEAETRTRPLEDEFRLLHPRMTQNAVERAKSTVIILVSLLLLTGALLLVGCVLYLRSCDPADKSSTPLKRGKNFQAWKPERDAPSVKYEIKE